MSWLILSLASANVMREYIVQGVSRGIFMCDQQKLKL
jgi:hypothetical protein